MTNADKILAHFSGGLPGEQRSRPLYLPDLTLWYDYHRGRDTLPDGWKRTTLPQIARELNVPIWTVSPVIREHAPTVNITTTEQDGERVIRSESKSGVITARWIIGPDGAMWQTEYPVKSAPDLDVVLDLAEARQYSLDPELTELSADVGTDGVVAVEIPRRPVSDLLHEYLGWAEGLMLFLEEPDKIEAIIGTLEEKLQDFVGSLAMDTSQIVYSPDNLDGQFISPRMFRDHLAGSYSQTAELLHQQGKKLVVHIGGPIRRLLAPLAEAGVDGLEGIVGPPQSDAGLAEARNLVGGECMLWGGVSQDYLMGTSDANRFRERSERSRSSRCRRSTYGCRRRGPRAGGRRSGEADGYSGLGGENCRGVRIGFIDVRPPWLLQGPIVGCDPCARPRQGEHKGRTLRGIGLGIQSAWRNYISCTRCQMAGANCMAWSAIAVSSSVSN